MRLARLALRVRPTPQPAVFDEATAMTLFARAGFDPAFALCDLSCFRLERADLCLLLNPDALADLSSLRLCTESTTAAANASGGPTA